MIIKQDIRTGTEPVVLSNGTRVYEYTHIVKGAFIGRNSMIGQGCYVGGGAHIGDNVRIQNGNNIWDGVAVGNHSFIGPTCHLTNDHDPSDKEKTGYDCTTIGSGTTICAGVTIVAPCIIGDDVLIGAGSLVLRDIENEERVYGTIKRKS